ncbi:hypothetical protein [Shewanella sp. M-Br]|uniref:hypothetical protein n=1 Tax=Shewanella sp. M-Br TaxID=2495595 RepID=UPI002949C873|nr:hypothetical protein SMBr_07590 [Shewanella sp. M-Br]
MSIVPLWLNRLSRDSKGIWGVINQVCSTRAYDSIVSLDSKNIQVETIKVINDLERLVMIDSANNVVHCLDDFANLQSVISREYDRCGVRIIVNDFHKASISDQCSLIKNARKIQESAVGDLVFQFIFCGSWSYFAFCENYMLFNGKTSSPAAEYKNILYEPILNSSDTIQKLKSSGVMSNQNDEIAYIACDYLVEQTAGNEYLINNAIDYLVDKSGTWFLNVEQVVKELASSPDVIEKFKLIYFNLSSIAKVELFKLLDVHVLVRPIDSVVLEELWISGLVVREPFDARKYQVRIASSLINCIIRNICIEFLDMGENRFAPFNDLCLEGSVISSSAYRKVAIIENLFRSLIVSVWHKDFDIPWTENLKFTKVSLFEDGEEELINLVLKCMKENFPVLNNQDESVVSSHSSERKNKSTLLESAIDWMNRQNNHHSVQLANSNLMHFMTTESLELVIRNKSKGLVGDGKVFNRDYLIVAFDEYR